MNPTPSDLVRRFDRLRVLVLGDAILDSYLDGQSHRLCREAPVPIVTIANRTDVPGGGANTAANLSCLKATVHFLSVVGDDAEARLLRRALQAGGVATDGLISAPARQTLAKSRVVASVQLLVRFDQGTGDPIDAETERALLDRLTGLFARVDAVIVSDYGYGVMTPGVIDRLGRLQASSPRILVVDARNLPAYRFIGVTAVKPNYEEATALLGPRAVGTSRLRADAIAPHGERILDLTGAQIAAVTLDTEGALVFERGRPAYRTYARPTPQSRAAGAGDTFVAALTLALAAGGNTPQAVEVASAAASIVVGRDGTSVCSRQQLTEFFTASGKALDGLERVAARAAFHREQGRRIVFTNGCFDILHRGHITYLNRAKALGDLLVVGINSDESVRRLKGDGRPINTLEDRVQVLAALSCIDHIVPFDGDTPAALIEAIRPDVFVKGGDYTIDRLPEAALVEELGGTVQLLPFVEDQSTTGIIERIRQAERRAAQGE